MLLNVCGLKSKLRAPDFEEYIQQYDIVCLTETKLGKGDTVSLNNFEIFAQNRDKCKHASGGVAVLVKNDLVRHVEIVHGEAEFALWFKIKPELLGVNILGGAIIR